MYICTQVKLLFLVRCFFFSCLQLASFFFSLSFHLYITPLSFRFTHLLCFFFSFAVALIFFFYFFFFLLSTLSSFFFFG